MQQKIKFKITKIFLIFLTLGIFSNQIMAADPAPMVMLKNTANQMIVELNKNLGNLKNNNPLVSNIVKRIVVPHVDLVAMSQLVVGRAYWQQSNSGTQREFVSEFTDYVINTYAAAISNYDGETMKFFPIRGDVSGKNRVQITSAIMRRNGPPIKVQYSLVNRGSNWMIFDFSIEGISLVQNYRAQFASPLRQGGLTNLVNELRKRNK